jgi:hypothetical protein
MMGLLPVMMMVLLLHGLWKLLLLLLMMMMMVVVVVVVRGVRRQGRGVRVGTAVTGLVHKFARVRLMPYGALRRGHTHCVGAVLQGALLASQTAEPRHQAHATTPTSSSNFLSQGYLFRTPRNPISLPLPLPLPLPLVQSLSLSMFLCFSFLACGR